MYVYVSEFCNNAGRPRAVVLVAALCACSMVTLPAMAFVIIPSTWVLQVGYNEGVILK